MELPHRLEQLSLLRPLVAACRRLWRWYFAWRCRRQIHCIIRDRAKLVRESADFHRLPRVPLAGCVRGGVQIMHNGLKVRKGSYYGSGSIPLFRRTLGIHEPQEEIAFAAVLPHLPKGATMLELGSYWALYSIWFAATVPGARCHLVEPEHSNLEIGLENFRLNHLAPASATQAFVDRACGSTPDGVPVVNLPHLVAQLDLAHIHLLHADIQGYELPMLEGAADLIAAGRIDFFFISTHSSELHATCRALLASHQLKLLMDVSPADSYSIDGALVSQRPNVPGPGPVHVALRSGARTPSVPATC